MDPSGDELAGIVDLFGGLTRAELGEALVELAFRDGTDREPAAFAGDIDDALAEYYLVAVEYDGVIAGEEKGGDETEGSGTDGGTGPEGETELLVPGPVAFPELPEHATDLPHIMDISGRHVDRERVGNAAEERFRADTARAVAAGDDERMRELLDVSYELEAWAAPVELSTARDRLDDARS